VDPALVNVDSKPLPSMSKKWEAKTKEVHGSKDAPLPAALLDLAEWALAHGMLAEFTKTMDELALADKESLIVQGLPTGQGRPGQAGRCEQRRCALAVAAVLRALPDRREGKGPLHPDPQQQQQTKSPRSSIAWIASRITCRRSSTGSR